MEKKRKRHPIPPKRKPDNPTPPLLLWFRSVGATSSLLGGIGLMSMYFWWAVAFVYLGLSLWVADLQFEPWFRSNRPARIIGTGVFAVIGIAFSVGVVFRSAPLEMDALIPSGEYTAGTVISGVKWNSEFTALRVMLNNPTSLDYDNLEALIEPDASIVHISEITSSGLTFLGDVTKEVTDIGGVIAKLPSLTRTDPDGTVVNIQQRQLSTPRYRIRGKLAKSSSAQLVLIIAEIDRARTPGATVIAPADYDGDASQPVTVLGPDDMSVITYKKHRPTTIRIQVSYTAGLRPRSADTVIRVGSL